MLTTKAIRKEEVQACAYKELEIPGGEKGFIPTLNHYGYMLEVPDNYSQKFIEYAGKVKGPVLDIGAAYGVATIPALEKGARVVANDLDARHLYLLAKRISPSLRENLTLKAGRFPYEVQLPSNTFSAILASGVLHYLKGEELEDALGKIFSLLHEGGKFFFFTSTPYIGIFRDFLPLFYERKSKNMKWPGVITNSWEYAPHRKNNIPQYINLLDEETISTLLKKAGFLIEKKEYVSMLNYPTDIQGEGKEYIGFIATKR